LNYYWNILSADSGSSSAGNPDSECTSEKPADGEGSTAEPELTFAKFGTNEANRGDPVVTVSPSVDPSSDNVSRLEDLNFGFPVDFQPDEPEGLLYTGFISLLPISNTSSSFFQPTNSSATPKEAKHGRMIDKYDSSEVPGTLEFTEIWETQENATAYPAEFDDVVYLFEWKWEFFPGKLNLAV